MSTPFGDRNEGRLDRIEAQSLTLVERLRKELTARGFKVLTPEATRSSIVTFCIREESPAAEKTLEEARTKVAFRTATAPRAMMRKILARGSGATESRSA